MIYRWTIELHVKTDEIEIPGRPGETWLHRARRDIDAMEAPSSPYGDVVTELGVEFEPFDPPGSAIATVEPDE